MAWEERRNGRDYYYQKRRLGGRVVSEYVGTGLLAQYAAQLDGLERHKRTMARLALAGFIRDQRRVDQAVDTYRAQVRGVVAEALHHAGFHQHKGMWRLKRREAAGMADEVAKDTKDEVTQYIELMRAAEGKKKVRRWNVCGSMPKPTRPSLTTCAC